MQQHEMKLHRSNVGDKYVLEIMNREGINFGGEQSGHVIMHDYAKTGDGLVSALQTLALVLHHKKPASEVLRPFALYPQKLVNLNISEKKPLEKIEGLQEKYAALDAQNIRYLVRYSGTENKLRVLLEGKEAKAMELAMDDLTSFFRKALNG